MNEFTLINSLTYQLRQLKAAQLMQLMNKSIKKLLN